MIAIINDQGQSLDLFVDINLVTEQAVAWLVDDELPGEFSYPIDAPLNERNRKFVQHGYRPDSSAPRQVMPVTVQMEGVLYRRCQFAYKVQSGKLNGYLKIDSAEFYDKIRKLTLLEALPDQINLGDGLAMVNGAPTTVPLANRMQTIAEMAPGQFPCTFFPIRNESFFEDSFDSTKLENYTRQLYINVWTPTGFKTDLSGTEKGFMVVPQFYLNWVLTRIMELAGYRIESDWLASPEIQRLTIFNLTALQTSTTFDHGLPVNLFGNHTVTAGMHLPDMSVSDFLKAIKGKYGLVFTFNANDRVCHISQFIQTLAAGPSIDLTDYQVGAYDTDNPNGKGYAVRDYIDEQDALYKNDKGETIQPDPLLVGDGGQEITLKAGTTQLVYEPSGLTGSGQWFIPTVRQPGNVIEPDYKLSERYLDEKGKRKNIVGLRLLSYRGMTQDSKNQPYPLATPDVRDGKQQVIGQQATALAGRYGIWRTGLRQYFYFRDRTQKVVQPLLLPVAVLAQLQLHRSVWLSLEDQIRRSYVIAKLQAQAPGQDGRVMARLEAQTIPAGLDLSADSDEPTVWVELKIESSYAETPGLPGFPTRRITNKLTLTVWADAAKTQPAIPTALVVTIRLRKSYLTNYPSLYTPPSAYADVRTNYVLNTQSTVVEQTFDSSRQAYSTSEKGHLSDWYHGELLLDPGEGYTLLPLVKSGADYKEFANWR